MDPSGAGTYSITAMSPAMKTRATPVERLMVALSDKQGTLLVHLVVWLLAILSGIFLGLRFIAIWYRKLVLVLDDGLLIASWVRCHEWESKGRHTMPLSWHVPVL